MLVQKLPRLFTLAATALFLTSAYSASAHATGIAPTIAAASQLDFDLPVQNFSLANGLRVYVVEDHSTPAFNMTLLYNVGSRHEVKGRTGFAHFFEHMMFEGTKNIPPWGHMAYVERVGGDSNAGTIFDFTLYYNNLPSHYLDLGLWLESERLRALAITDENFENQRKNVKEEKATGENQPYSKAIEDWLAEVWTGTGYDHPIIGSLEDLEAAETKDVQAFFNRYYAPNNAVLVIVGDVDFAEVKQKVEQNFGAIPQAESPPPPPADNLDRSKTIHKVVKDKLAQQPMYVLGWHSVGESHPDRPALDLLGNILLVGESARIPKVLQDQKKLAVFAGGAHFATLGTGLMFVQAIPTPNVPLADIQTVVVQEAEKIKKKGIAGKELQKAINIKTMETVETLATNQGRAQAIAQGALFFNDPKYVLTELKRYQTVTPKDIQRVAKQYLNENVLTLEIQPGN